VKLKTLILFAYLGFLVASPAFCGVVNAILCQSTAQSGENNSEENPSDHAPCTPCCSASSSCCDFFCPAALKVEALIEEESDRLSPQNEFAQSQFLSEIWNPPRHS